MIFIKLSQLNYGDRKTEALTFKTTAGHDISGNLHSFTVRAVRDLVNRGGLQEVICSKLVASLDR